MRERDEVGGDRGVAGVVLDALHERAVHLDHVDREAAQLAERREAGAEVVDRDAHSQLVEVLQLGAGAVARRALGHDCRLRDLEAEEAGRQPGLVECAAHHVAHAAVRELSPGQVHPGDEGVGHHPLDAPLGGLTAGVTQHQLPERQDQPGGLGDGDEVAR